MKKAIKVLSVSLIFLFILSFFTPLYNSLNCPLFQYVNTNTSTPLQQQDAGHYFITSNWMIQNIIVDGNITSVLEWSDATVLNLFEPESPINASLYFKNNATHLAILCDAFGDESQDASSIQTNFDQLDHFDLGFDTGNDKIRSNNAEDSYSLLANSTLIRWKYSTTSNTYGQTVLSGEIGAVSFGSSSKNLNAHEIYEVLIPISLLSLTPGQLIGIGSEFNSTISTQGWPYDNNSNQKNDYPNGILSSDMTTWGQLKLAQKPPSLIISNPGNQGTSLLMYTNSTATAINSSDSKDFTIPVPTDQWGLAFTNQTFKDLKAPNISRTLDTGISAYALTNYYVHMGFNVTNDCWLHSFSIRIDDSTSIGNLSYSVLGATWDVATSKPKPNTANVLKSGLIVLPHGGPYWLDVLNVDVFLNVSTTNTHNNTFFVTLSGVPFDDTTVWYSSTDSTTGDAGPAWRGWGTLTYITPNPRDFDLTVNLIPISNTPTPTQVGMKVNGSAVSASGNWKSSSRYTSATGKVFFNVTTKWPLAYNVSYNCNYNKTVTSQSNYYITAGENPSWIINWSAQFPANAKNYQMNVSIPIDWTVDNIKNGTYPTLGLYSSAHWSVVTTRGHKVVAIKNITNVALQSWFINCTAPNYVPAINVYSKAGMNYSLLNLADDILITEILHINGTISSPIAGTITDLIHGANLTTYLPGVRTCYIENNIKPKTGVANFTDWVIADATNEAGTYILQVMWANGTEVGLNEVSLKIIYPTSTAVFVDQMEKVAPFSVDWFIDAQNSINITAFYNNTFPDKLGAISTTDASYRIINDSTLWISWNSLDQEKIGAGYYNKTLDVTNWLNGTYYIGIKLNKTGYQVQEFNITLQLGYNTGIELKLPVSSQIQSIYPENLQIHVNYTKYTGDMLLSADVYCTINGGSPISLVVRGNLFSIQLNSTDYGVGNYNITIFASQMGYYPRQLYINWTVQTCPTGATYDVNGSYSKFEFYIGEQMFITSYFNDTTHDQPTSNAIATLAWLGEAPISPSGQGLGYYNWTIDSSTQPAGLWNFSLELKKPNYQNQTIQFDIYVRYNTTLEWFTPPPLTIQPFITLTMAVNLSHFTLIPTQVPVANQPIIYSITTNLGVTNYSKITNTAGIASFSDLVIPVGVTSLSIQVIYGGNLTEFPTTLPGSVIILYPTRADVFVDKVNLTGGSLMVYKFIGLQSLVNFTVFYYNSTFPTKVGIPAASAEYRIVNKTGGLWVPWTNLNELGGGYYNKTLDVSAWQNDTYYIGIRLNKTGFQMQQFNITMNLVFSTNIMRLQPTSASIEMFYPENLTIQVNYTKQTGAVIPTAYVRVTLNGTITLPLTIIGGIYRIRLNSTAYGVGTYILSINASLLGYYPQSFVIIWRVNVCRSNYQVYVNWSHSLNQFYYGEQMRITIRYYDTVHSQGLQYAVVNITLPSGPTQTLGGISGGNYSIVLDSSSRSPGLWNLAFLIQKPNYQNYTFNLQLYARYTTNLQSLSVISTRPTAGETLSLVVNMTHNDGMPVPNQKITFIITTNLKQENFSVFTNGLGISSYDYIILSGVKTVHIIAVFDGNSTEFSSSVTVTAGIDVVYGGFWENYWWTLIIGAVLAIVAVAAVRSRSKAKAIKESKKKEIMSSFQDVTKILHLVVIHKGSGTDIFDYKVQERLDPTLLAGFIQAVKEFGREIDKGEK